MNSQFFTNLFSNISRSHVIIVLSLMAIAILLLSLYPLTSGLIAASTVALYVVWKFDRFEVYRSYTLYAAGITIVMAVVYIYEPELAITVIVLALLYGLTVFVPHLSRYKLLVLVGLIVAILWRPFFIYILPHEAVLYVNGKEDHQGIFIAAGEFADGKTMEFEVRDAELFALQFNRDFLWSQFKEGRSTRVKYYGQRWTLLDIYPKVFFADLLPRNINGE